MKRIVDGHKYDTETATEIANTRYSAPGDFGYWSETLYKTINGRYFIDGEGGPLSMYSESIGNNSIAGRRWITPLSREEAYKWCEEHDQVDAIENEFSDKVKDA